MTFDPDAPGRGPGRLHATYSVELLDDDEIFIGRFIGVVAATEKGNDILYWLVDGETRETPYRTIAATIRLAICPECGKRTLRRMDNRDWLCALCGHETEQPDRHEGRRSYATQRP